jgi:hypothetical protein
MKFSLIIRGRLRHSKSIEKGNVGGAWHDCDMSKSQTNPDHEARLR